MKQTHATLVSCSVVALLSSSCSTTKHGSSAEASRLAARVPIAQVIKKSVTGKSGLSADPTSLTIQDIVTTSSSPGDAQSALRAQLQLAYAEIVVHDCGTLLKTESATTNYSRWSVLGVALLGTVAGSVVVPALAAKAVVAKSTVAAWGGVSGASNALQSTVGQVGLSPEAQSQVRAGVVAALGPYAKTYADGWKTFPTDVNSQISALKNMRITCDIPPDASASAVTLITQSAIPPPVQH
jgi:hypothetical protein